MKNAGCVLLAIAMLWVPTGQFQGRALSTAAPGPARLEQLVEANIVAVHAYQVLLARKQPNAGSRLLGRQGV